MRRRGIRIRTPGSARALLGDPAQAPSERMGRRGIRLHRVGGRGHPAPALPERGGGSAASPDERFERFSFTGELPVPAPRCASARVGGGVEEAGVALILAFARCENSRSVRRRQLGKNVDGMLMEDEVKKVRKEC